jgi:hypothetical protein
MIEYASSAAVYRELRAAFGPWCKENGYKRQRGTDAGWRRVLGNGEDLRDATDTRRARSINGASCADASMTWPQPNRESTTHVRKRCIRVI